MHQHTRNALSPLTSGAKAYNSLETLAFCHLLGMLRGKGEFGMQRPLLLLLVTTLFALPSRTQAQVDVAGELVTLHRDHDALTREVATLRDHLVLLEARILDQQKQLAELKESRSLAALNPAATGPSDQYLRAFGEYAAGRYPQAIVALQAFIRSNPDNEFAGNAQFWLGDCYFAQKQYAVAVAELRKVVGNYPQAGKAPDALAKIATALQALKLDEQAREALDTLRTRYPKSAAARQAAPRTDASSFPARGIQ
jgi:tol-pal system protein YbgF